MEKQPEQQNQQAKQQQVTILHQGLIQKSGKLSGSQSDVYLVRGLRDNTDKILKIIRQKDLKSYYLEKEALKQLQQNNLCQFGFPNLISCMEGKEHVEMLIEAQGTNLRKLQQEQEPAGKYSFPTIYRIIIQLLDRIEQLHSIHLVHNDLKLENVVIGADDPNKIYLIDFGLTSKIVDDEGEHIVKEYIRNFSGNFLFASLNSCRGFNKSRRDDIESIFYIFIYLIQKDYLPWCDLLSKEPNSARPDLKVLLKERLDLKYTRKLFNLVPAELTDCLKKVLTLTFDEAPNYNYYRESLANCAVKQLKLEHRKNEKGLQMSSLELLQAHEFEWVKKHTQAAQLRSQNSIALRKQPAQNQSANKGVIVQRETLENQQVQFMFSKNYQASGNVISSQCSNQNLLNARSIALGVGEGFGQESRQILGSKSSIKLRNDLQFNHLASFQSFSQLSNSSLGSIKEQLSDWEDDPEDYEIQKVGKAKNFQQDGQRSVQLPAFQPNQMEQKKEGIQKVPPMSTDKLLQNVREALESYKIPEKSNRDSSADLQSSRINENVDIKVSQIIRVLTVRVNNLKQINKL